MRTAPVDGVRSTLRNFRLGGLAERAKATPVLRTYDGDTKYQLGDLQCFVLQVLTACYWANGFLTGLLLLIEINPHWINSLAPGGFVYSIRLVNFKLISMINISSISCEIVIRWMLQHLTDHWSTLVQVMAWCRQATSHYLSQCWPRSLSPYDVTRPQWVNELIYVLQGAV